MQCFKKRVLPTFFDTRRNGKAWNCDGLMSRYEIAFASDQYPKTHPHRTLELIMGSP